MTIPAASSYPDKMDDDDNLFLVHDALRVRLSEDYSPGDKVVYVDGDTSDFPETGIITLTEQCSDIDVRALSFYYAGKTSSAFEGLEILPEFEGLDSAKPKKATNVTMNVVSMHHNHLKDAIIKVQEFVGTKYGPKEDTITGRIDLLKKVVFSPKAWFSSNVSYGLVQSFNSAGLKVTFKNESLRVGDGFCRQTWDFGDGSSSVVETNNPNEYLANLNQEKTYLIPGVYTVSLTVENEYGSDTVVFDEMIAAKSECPDQATIRINHRASQSNLSSGLIPKIRSATNTFVDLEILDDGGRPGDSVAEYTWRLGDDLPHPNSIFARASYGKGGYYDITLRVDTSFGSYRITTYEKSIDIIEKSNLWLFNYKPSSYESDSGGTVRAHEFGLNSETFKTLGNSDWVVDRSNSFLGNAPLDYDSEDYYYETMGRAKKEFEGNVEFAGSGSSFSGEKGDSLIFWAKGGEVVDSKEIGVRKYNGFDDTYSSLPSITNRPWNWVAMSSSDRTYFLFGQASPVMPGENRAVAERVEYDMATQTAASPVTLSASDFENGADELLEHPSDPMTTNGYFASYRSAWKDQTGYILRNSSVNEFFRFGDFYRTKGSLASPFGSITKMPDIPGSVKTEGQLVALSNGVFFFNNSGEVCAWNDTSLVWEVGRASSTSLSFRTVQDSSAQNFDDKSQTLKATSDGDRAAYLSYDYSNKAFIKFNGTDLTFTILRSRPEGTQFKIGVY